MTFQPETVGLHDGTSILIRPIQPDDRERVEAMHARLSRHTLLLRYLSAARKPTTAQAVKVCDFDLQRNMALVALPCDQKPAQIVAMACYVLPDPADARCAEVGILVEDAYQGRGLGTILLVRLGIYAQSHGVCEMSADIAYENSDILSFIQNTGLPHHETTSQGLVHVTVLIEGDLTDLAKRITFAEKSARA